VITVLRNVDSLTAVYFDLIQLRYSVMTKFKTFYAPPDVFDTFYYK